MTSRRQSSSPRGSPGRQAQTAGALLYGRRPAGPAPVREQAIDRKREVSDLSRARELSAWLYADRACWDMESADLIELARSHFGLILDPGSWSLEVEQEGLPQRLFRVFSTSSKGETAGSLIGVLLGPSSAHGFAFLKLDQLPE